MMNRDFLVQFVRLLVLIITIVYLNVCSCGQNAFGAHANRNSTSDSEFVHIVVWVAFAIDLFVFLSRSFDVDDGTKTTSLIVDCAFSLMFFVAFVILFVSSIKCSSSDVSFFCHGLTSCWIYLLPIVTTSFLSILYVFGHIRKCHEEFHRIQ